MLATGHIEDVVTQWPPLVEIKRGGAHGSRGSLDRLTVGRNLCPALCHRSILGRKPPMHAGSLQLCWNMGKDRTVRFAPDDNWRYQRSSPSKKPAQALAGIGLGIGRKAEASQQRALRFGRRRVEASAHVVVSRPKPGRGCKVSERIHLQRGLWPFETACLMAQRNAEDRKCFSVERARMGI